MARLFFIFFLALGFAGCLSTPPFRTGKETFDEQHVEFDFINISEKIVESLEVTLRSDAGEPCWVHIPVRVPPEGSTRIHVPVDYTEEPITSFAITRITYNDGAVFIDLGGHASGVWW